MLCPPARAGVYLADERVPFTVAPDGTASELPYEPQFKSLLDDRVNAAVPVTPLEVAGKPTMRGTALARLNAAPARPSAPESVELAALELRVGRRDAALNRLRPLALARTPDYVALVTLAQVHAARLEWGDAKRMHDFAILDAEPPATLPGATAEQTRWLLKVEKQYTTRWLQVRATEPARGGLETQQAPDVFPGVKFVGESGRYEPGKLAAAERAKLPPDAVAIVQQLALSAPDDTGLLWLLAELYATDGRDDRLRDAEKLIEQCTARGLTNRSVLMSHRQAVMTAVGKLPPLKVDDLTDDPPPPPAGPSPEIVRAAAAGVGAAAVALVMLALQVRAWVRRARR